MPFTNQEARLSFFGACEERFQEKIQAHLPRCALEPALTASYPIDHDSDLQKFFRTLTAALHNLYFLRKYRLFFLHRFNRWRNGGSRRQRGRVFQNQPAEISLFILKKHLLSYKFRTDSHCVFSVLHY